MSHMYMQSHRRRKGNYDLIRAYAPYVITASLVLMLFWGVDSLKQDVHRHEYEPAQLVQPSAAARPTKDWTHKLSTDEAFDDQTRPDDDTTLSCPLPTGNWAHTCDRSITVEGPCSGKCMLKAHCKNLKEKFADTTFEYNEGLQLEIKNVNGLLCKMEDGTPSCGVNFHGNMALKNCLGYIPRRREILPDGLYVTEDMRDIAREDADWKKKEVEPNIKDETDEKRAEAYAENEEPKRPRRKRWEEDEDRDPRRHARHAVGAREPPARRGYEGVEDVRPPKRAAAPLHEDDARRRGYRNDEPEGDDLLHGPAGGVDNDGDSGADRRLRGRRRSRHEEKEDVEEEPRIRVPQDD